MEVGVSGIDTANPVLAHQDRSARVMYHISGEVRECSEYLGNDRGMPFCGDKDAQARGGKQRLNEFPRLRDWPRLPKDSGVRRHPKEFVQNAPRHIPSRGLASPVLEACMASRVKGGVRIGGVDEDVRVRDEH